MSLREQILEDELGELRGRLEALERRPPLGSAQGDAGLAPLSGDRVLQICEASFQQGISEFARHWDGELRRFVKRDELSIELRDLVKKRDWIGVREHFQGGIECAVEGVTRLQAAVDSLAQDVSQIASRTPSVVPVAPVSVPSVSSGDTPGPQPELWTTRGQEPLRACESEVPLRPFSQAAVPERPQDAPAPAGQRSGASQHLEASGPMTQAEIEAFLISFNMQRQEPPHVSLNLTPPVGTPAPVSLSPAQPPRVKPWLAAKLERDPEGLSVLIQWELATGLQPTQEIKMRLRREYGLYSRSWSEAFGPEHLEGEVREVVGIRMISDASDMGPPSSQAPRD